MPDAEPSDAKARVRLASIAVCSLVLVSPACTLLSDLAVHQCESSSDCDILDGSMHRCVDSQCVAGCESNHHCNEFDPRAPICPALGAQCASLTTDDGLCYVSTAYDDAAMGGLVGSDLDIVGAFAPSLSSSTWLTLDLAATELNTASLVTGGELAPTLAVLCRGGDDAVASMEHLAGRLRVDAVVASLDAVPLDAVRRHPEFSGQVLLLSPNPTEAAAADDDARMVWHLGGRYREAVPVFTEAVRRLQGIIERGWLTPNRGLRIASLISEAREDGLLSDLVEAALELEGRSANYLFREGRFRRFPLDDDSPDARANVLADVGAYAPDLILVFAGGEFRAPSGEPRLGVLRELEERVANEAVWSPFYVLGPRALGDDATNQLARTSDRFRASALGVTVDRAPEIGRRREGLLARYTSAFPEAFAAGLPPAFNVYDALYYASQAAAVARRREQAIFPDALIDGLARVSDPRGECVDVEPAGIPLAIEHIRRGASFQLCGATGSARFTPDHARGGQASLFCWTGESAGDDCASLFEPLEGTP